MKSYLSYILFAVALLAGCSKNDGPVPNNIILQRAPEPQVVKEGGSQAIDVMNLAGFEGKFSVGVYNANGMQPAKYDVVVRKNGAGVIKIFHPDITTFPTPFTFKISDLESLFGDPVELGDNYDIGVDVYTASGKKYAAFPPAGGAGYSSGISEQPGASASIRYSAICQYHDDIYQGDFKVLVDGWGDYLPGTIVPVTRIDETHFSFKYGALDALPIIITVDPLTNITSVAKQVYGPIGYPPGWPFGPISCETIPSVKNIVSPCDQTFGVVLMHSVDIGAFTDEKGAYIEMQKVN